MWTLARKARCGQGRALVRRGRPKPPLAELRGPSWRCRTNRISFRTSSRTSGRSAPGVAASDVSWASLHARYEDEIERLVCRAGRFRGRQVEAQVRAHPAAAGRSGPRSAHRCGAGSCPRIARYDNPIVQLPTQPDRVRPGHSGRPRHRSRRPVAAGPEAPSTTTAVPRSRENCSALVPSIYENSAAFLGRRPTARRRRPCCAGPARRGRTPRTAGPCCAHTSVRGVSRSWARNPREGSMISFDRGRMADLADLAALGRAGQGQGAVGGPHHLVPRKPSPRATTERTTWPIQVAQQREGGFRAFLLAAAMFEEEPRRRRLPRLQRSLLQSVGSATGHELEQPDRMRPLSPGGRRDREKTRASGSGS